MKNENPYFNFSPIYPNPEEPVARGISVNKNLKDVNLGIYGINTEQGDSYGANMNYNLMNLFKNMTEEERMKYVAQVGVNYNYTKDINASNYSPMFSLGYNNINQTGGWGASVNVDSRMQPQISAQYTRRF
jgi:hypothetical protein